MGNLYALTILANCEKCIGLQNCCHAREIPDVWSMAPVLVTSLCIMLQWIHAGFTSLATLGIAEDHSTF